MPPPAHAADSEEKDLETLTKEEFARLQRQYRLMESNRRAYAEENGTNVARDHRRLANLEKEKEDLLTDLHNALCTQNQAEDKLTIATILEIMDRFTEHQFEIDHQLGEIDEMEEQVAKITQRVIQQKLKVQSLFGHSMTVAQADKRLRILENRLYHYTTCFDTQVTKNQCVRAEVDLHLAERGRFHRRYEYLKRKLSGLKRHMSLIVDTASNTYDQREEASAKIHSHRERNDKESKQHVLEMKEFQRILHHDEKGHGFMQAKGRIRPLLEDNEVRRRRLDRAKERSLDDLLISYRISFRDILVVASTRDVETLVQSYMAQEQRNFARFKYVSDLNNEVQSLLQVIDALKEEIDEKAEIQKEIRAVQEQKLVDLAIKHKACLEKFDECSVHMVNTEQKMEEIVRGVQENFGQANCGNAPIIRLLGNRSGISPQNAALCLNVLEHRIAELLYDKSVLEIRKSVELEGGQLPSKGQQPAWQGGVKPKPTGGPFKPRVMITGRIDPTGEADDDDEDKTAGGRGSNRKPLTFEQLYNLLLGKLETSLSPQPSETESESTSRAQQSKVSIAQSNMRLL